jgi:lipopolysaccharide transport system ATP-binding protein
MTNTVIAIDNLGKYYRLGVIGSRTLREDINKWYYRLRRKEDPALPIIDAHGERRRGEDLWAIRNINLEVKSGEIVGVIGRNGAGKSTLLKILSSITSPTTGTIKLSGRIGSLLEVGTGFHPELTGRENIYLNGAILGMKRVEIEEKLNEIIEFSEISDFIDTPIKRYSSGMTVRLAFAVAAHLEPEILLVDEVLAVGDVEFQKKCIGKMDEVSKNGRTIIFVSHNLSSIRRLCNRLVVLKNGEKIHDGNVEEGINKYLDDMRAIDNGMPLLRSFEAKNKCSLKSIQLLTDRSNARFFQNDRLKFRVVFEINASYSDLELNISFWDRDVKIFMLFGSRLAGRGFGQKRPFGAGRHELIFELPASLFWAGIYHVSLALHMPGTGLLHQELGAITFEILNNADFVEKYRDITKAMVMVTPDNVSYQHGCKYEC